MSRTCSHATAARSGGVLIAFGVLVGACSGSSERSAAQAPVTPERAAALRQGATSPPPHPQPVPPPRLVPVAAACRGPRLSLDAELSQCACDEDDIRETPDGKRMQRAGRSCGKAHPEEGVAPDVDVRLEKTSIVAGTPVRVTVVFRNGSGATRIYRAASRYLRASFVRSDGTPLADIARGWDGNYNDEALFELPPSGEATVSVEVPSSVGRWEGGKTVVKALDAGAYAIAIRLGSIGGDRIVPIELR